MSRSLLLTAMFPALLAGGDPPALARAKAAHGKEVAKLRQDLLDAFEAEIKREAGNALDFLLAERKAFRDDGIVPILPTMAAAGRRYAAGKAAADEKLVAAYKVALKDAVGQEARLLAAELRDLTKPPAPPEDPARGLYDFLEGTTWAWAKGGELTLRPSGGVGHTVWDKAGFEMRWAAVSATEVKMKVVKGEGAGRYATLKFSPDRGSFTGTDFDGTSIGVCKKKK